MCQGKHDCIYKNEERGALEEFFIPFKKEGTIYDLLWPYRKKGIDKKYDQVSFEIGLRNKE
tara:strand:+ start:76 stop:258 length:183 start_codon:yes stop_codon:yes gene_type:complete